MVFFDILFTLTLLVSIVIIIRTISSSEKIKYSSNKLLLLLLAILSYGLARHLFMNLVQYNYNINFPVGLVFNSPIACSIPILCFLYVKKVINDSNTFNTSDIIHIFVFAFFYILYELPYMADRYEFFNLQSDHLYWFNYFNINKLPNWLIALRTVLNVFYNISTYILLHKSFKIKSSTKQDKIVRRLLNKFTHVKSSSKQVQLVRRWLYNFTHIKTIMTIATIFFTLKLLVKNEVYFNNQIIVSCGLAFIFFALALFLYKNKTILFNLPSFMDPRSLRREKIKIEIDAKKIYEYVTTQIEKDKLYLNKQFNLNWLAAELEIKAKHISIAIKENNFENFSVYSNHFKIQKAKKLIKNNYLQNYSIEALSLACGFKSVNTFYRIFKNETGITPNTYSEIEGGK
jgi:AraC-like DNA-binding protein